MRAHAFFVRDELIECGPVSACLLSGLNDGRRAEEAPVHVARARTEELQGLDLAGLRFPFCRELRRVD